ncbi:MAG: hypothetical protein JWM14_886 [Chitinophagaceae bacterium]|nr:hypothetical protein [Chitinophagaceae bacterium]
MIILLALLFVCHFLADFSPLSTDWMLRAKSKGSPLFPIFVHAGVHAFLMFAVLIFFTPILLAIKLAVFQWFTHFTIDLCKGKMNVWFPAVASPTDKRYWMLFGFDQFMHQIVILIMAWASFNF